jgi:hypothetical protein
MVEEIRRMKNQKGIANEILLLISFSLVWSEVFDSLISSQYGIGWWIFNRNLT